MRIEVKPIPKRYKAPNGMSMHGMYGLYVDGKIEPEWYGPYDEMMGALQLVIKKAPKG